jgi:hypothetical protein
VIEINKCGSNDMKIKKIGGVRNIRYRIEENKVFFKIKNDEKLVKMARNLIEDKIVFDYSIETMEKEVRI